MHQYVRSIQVVSVPSERLFVDGRRAGLVQRGHSILAASVVAHAVLAVHRDTKVGQKFAITNSDYYVPLLQARVKEGYGNGLSSGRRRRRQLPHRGHTRPDREGGGQQRRLQRQAAAAHHSLPERHHRHPLRAPGAERRWRYGAEELSLHDSRRRHDRGPPAGPVRQPLSLVRRSVADRRPAEGAAQGQGGDRAKAGGGQEAEEEGERRQAAA